MEDYMEKTTIKTRLDFKTLKYCNLFIMKFKRKAGLWFLITAIISLGIIVYDVLVVKDKYLFTILGAVFILYSGYQFINLEKRLDTQLARFFYNKRVTDQTVEITDEKIVVTRSIEPDKPAEFDWSYVTEILEMPQYYMLMIGKGAPIILDRSPEAILEGSKEHLDAIIKDKASMKPYKVTDKDIVKIPITYVHPEFPEVVAEEVVEENNELEKPLEVEDSQDETAVTVEAEVVEEEKKEE
jgi:hypothetical protein